MHKTEKARAQRELRRLMKDAHTVAPGLETSILSWAARWIDGKAKQCREMTEQALERYRGEMDEETIQRLAEAFSLAYVNDKGAITIDHPDEG